MHNQAGSISKPMAFLGGPCLQMLSLSSLALSPTVQRVWTQSGSGSSKLATGMSVNANDSFVSMWPWGWWITWCQFWLALLIFLTEPGWRTFMSLQEKTKRSKNKFPSLNQLLEWDSSITLKHGFSCSLAQQHSVLEALHEVAFNPSAGHIFYPEPQLLLLPRVVLACKLQPEVWVNDEVSV